MCIRQGTTEPWPRKHYAYTNTTVRVHIIRDNYSQYNRTLAIQIRTAVTSVVQRITCANLSRPSASASVTAIGFKGQCNNNNRGGGRRLASSPGPPRYIYAFIIRATFELLDIEKRFSMSTSSKPKVARIINAYSLGTRLGEGLVLLPP